MVDPGFAGGGRSAASSVCSGLVIEVLHRSVDDRCVREAKGPLLIFTGDGRRTAMRAPDLAPVLAHQRCPLWSPDVRLRRGRTDGLRPESKDSFGAVVRHGQPACRWLWSMTLFESRAAHLRGCPDARSEAVVAFGPTRHTRDCESREITGPERPEARRHVLVLHNDPVLVAVLNLVPHADRHSSDASGRDAAPARSPLLTGTARRFYGGEVDGTKRRSRAGSASLGSADTASVKSEHVPVPARRPRFRSS